MHLLVVQLFSLKLYTFVCPLVSEILLQDIPPSDPNQPKTPTKVYV